jgi:hypothetical protein
MHSLVIIPIVKYPVYAFLPVPFKIFFWITPTIGIVWVIVAIVRVALKRGAWVKKTFQKS